MKKIPKQIIKDALTEAEQKYGLPTGILYSIYDAEARVVFLGIRRGITKELRELIQIAIEGL